MPGGKRREIVKNPRTSAKWGLLLLRWPEMLRTPVDCISGEAPTRSLISFIVKDVEKSGTARTGSYVYCFHKVLQVLSLEFDCGRLGFTRTKLKSIHLPFE